MMYITFDHVLDYSGIIYSDLTYEYEGASQFVIEDIIERFTDEPNYVISDSYLEAKENDEPLQSVEIMPVEMPEDVLMERISLKLRKSRSGFQNVEIHEE